MEEEENKIDYVSYTQYRTYGECSRRYRLRYKERIKLEEDVIYLDFGDAIHLGMENFVGKENEVDPLKIYDDRIKLLTDEYNNPPDEEELLDLRGLASDYYEVIHEFLLETFPSGFEVIHRELELMEEVEGREKKFTGFIDLIIKTKAGRYVIIDWKTSKKDWHPKKREDPEVYNQLLLYKYFFNKKCDIPLDIIDTYFVLLRKDKPREPTAVKIESSESAVNKAYKSLHHRMGMMKTNLEFLSKWKNRGCFCPYSGTEYCG